MLLTVSQILLKRSKFCNTASIQFSVLVQSVKNEITITREQFFEFVKSKEDTEESSSPKYFLDYFDNYQKTGKRAGWNLAALFWSYVWFFYRGMYFYGFIVFLFLLTPAFLVKYFSPSNGTIENLLFVQT